jgi:hypothetical protein
MAPRAGFQLNRKFMMYENRILVGIDSTPGNTPATARMPSTFFISAKSGAQALSRLRSSLRSEVHRD